MPPHHSNPQPPSGNWLLVTPQYIHVPRLPHYSSGTKLDRRADLDTHPPSFDSSSTRLRDGDDWPRRQLPKRRNAIVRYAHLTTFGIHKNVNDKAFAGVQTPFITPLPPFDAPDVVEHAYAIANCDRHLGVSGRGALRLGKGWVRNRAPACDWFRA